MNIKKFGDVRKNGLKHWLKSTNRKRVDLDDNLYKTYECKWQNANKEGYHVSLFCSFGTFCTNITDLLTDERFDKIDPYKSEVNNQIIFRFYGRLFLVVSEILTDFEDIFNQIKENGKTKAREHLSIPSSPFTFHNFKGFTNNIFKHKLNSIHVGNHHADIYFDDFPVVDNDESLSFIDISTVRNLNNEPNIDFIKIPSLKSILDQVLYCYKVIDGLKTESNLNYKNFIEKYTTKDH